MKQYSKGASRDVDEKLNDIVALLMRYGGFTPPPTPILERKNDSSRKQPQNFASPSPSPPPQSKTKPQTKHQSSRGRGRSRGCGA